MHEDVTKIVMDVETVSNLRNEIKEIHRLLEGITLGFDMSPDTIKGILLAKKKAAALAYPEKA